MPRPNRFAVTTRSLASLVLSAGFLLAGCATVAPAPPEPAPAPAPPVAAEASAEMPPGLHWARNSAEVRAIYLQTYQEAGEALE